MLPRFPHLKRSPDSLAIRDGYAEEKGEGRKILWWAARSLNMALNYGISKYTNGMPDVVVVMEVGRCTSDSAAAVESKTESSILEVESNKVHMLVISHVEDYSIGYRSLQVHAEL